ncbi:hypothetical protein WGT02_39825 (plasmid) [Rhizobium sp. T1470]|uniref:hypothetical protein n=1 Tax=Rhizobium sp. T1470 TaxID=555320 RepID=UPI001AAEB94E
MTIGEDAILRRPEELDAVLPFDRLAELLTDDDVTRKHQAAVCGVVAWITRRLILSDCFQSPDRDFDDAAHVQCRSAGQDCQAEISSDELAGI